MVASIYATGEIRVNNRVLSAGYADLTKLFTMCGGVMADVEDARHILPVFRWIDWADELKMTAEEYWAEQGVLTQVDGAPYIAFADSRGPPAGRSLHGGAHLTSSAAPKDGAPTSPPERAWEWQSA